MSIVVANIDFQQRCIWVIEKGARERTVPFGVQTYRWLRRYVVAAGLEETDPLFPGRKGGPMARRTVDDIIKAYARRAAVRSD